MLGTGDRGERLPESVAALIRDKRLAVEVASTVGLISRPSYVLPRQICSRLLPPPRLAPTQVNAVTTFNILNQEGRKVVGAFLPKLPL